MKKLKYMSIDTECLEDYWSFQFRSNEMNKTKIYESMCDEHFHKLYNNLKKSNTAMYCYSINYDKAMINALCKFVENDIHDINYHMRQFNDILISQNTKDKGVDYFKVNKEFWGFFYSQVDEYDDHKELMNDCESWIKYKYFNNVNIVKLLDEYSFLLGKSEVFKELIIVDVPKMLGYYTVTQDGELRMSVSLKNLQLYYEGKNLKFDFMKYKTIDDIKKDDLYKKWNDYSINDVDFLHWIVETFCIPIIEARMAAVEILQKIDETRVYDDKMAAIEALQKIDETFVYNDRMIHNESDTKLITAAFGKHEVEHVIDLDYTKLIPETNYEKFNNLVKFVNDNKDIKKDKDLKTKYLEEQQKKHDDDDKTIVDVDVHGTICKIGFGGIHGAKEKYDNINMYMDDYGNLYPSIILYFKKLFSNIMNIERFKAVFDLRNLKIKPLKKNFKNMTQTEIDNVIRLDKGLKLLLNSSYGIVNSEFDFEMSNKQLGRLVCLFGQYKCLMLCDAIKQVSEKSNIVNVNTDGVIADNITEEEVKKVHEMIETDDFKLDYSKIDRLIQYDVNNYIKKTGDKMKTKGGSFNLGIKQMFSRHDTLSCNVKNALSLINGDKVEILPILFYQKNKKESSITLEGQQSSRDTLYYLCNKKDGILAVKHVIKPQILSLDGEIYYFTDDEDKADINEYVKFAKLTETKILAFDLNVKYTELKYYPYVLTPCLDKEENIKKNKIKLKLSKLFNNEIALIGYKGSYGNILTIGNKPIKQLSNYTMTDIRNSTETLGIAVVNNFKAHVFTNNENDQKLLDAFNTFESTHRGGKLYIFNHFNYDVSKLKATRIVQNPYIPVVTFNEEFQCNFKKPIDIL